MAPHRRRRGIGRELLALLTARARESGRIRMSGEVFAPLQGTGPGIAFAGAAGAVCAQVEIGRRLEFADIDHEAWARLAAERPG